MDGQKSSLGLRVGERGDGQRDLKIGQALKINRGVRSGRINNPPGSKQSRGTKWFPGSVGSGPGGDAKSFRILANGLPLHSEAVFSIPPYSLAPFTPYVEER